MSVPLPSRPTFPRNMVYEVRVATLVTLNIALMNLDNGLSVKIEEQQRLFSS